MLSYSYHLCKVIKDIVSLTFSHGFVFYSFEIVNVCSLHIYVQLYYNVVTQDRDI